MVKTKNPKSTLPVKPPNINDVPARPEDQKKGEALQSYITEIKRHPLLSPEREFEVAQKYFDHKDRDSAQLLVLSNLRLVVKIAHDYVRTGIHVLDLIQEGNIGLLQAVQEYNPYKGVKFSSYASYWIKAYIRGFILKNWSLVKMGTTRAQRTLFYRLQKEKAKLEAMGINPKPRLLADKLNVKETEVVEMSKRLSGRDVSLNAPLRPDENDGDNMLQLIRDQSEGADDRLAENEIQNEFSERLNSFERSLTGKELIVFRERMRSEEPKTLQEIGDVYGITRERVRQIEARVMEKLKSYMKENAKFMDNVIDVKY